MKRSLELQEAGIISFSSASNLDECFTIPDDFLAPEFSAGWAKRPKVGEIYIWTQICP
jgi:hypothetical protein